MNADPAAVSPSSALTPAHARSMLWMSVGAVLLLVVIALFVLMFVSRELRTAREAYDEVVASRQTLEELRGVFAALQDAETGERGFVITGDEKFLAPYREAAASLNGRLERLRVLERDPASQALMAELISGSTQQLAFLSEVIERRRTEGFDQAQGMISQQTGRTRMDRLRDVVRQLDRLETARLAQRIASFRARSASYEAWVRGALYGAIVLVLAVGVVLIRHTQRRLRAEEAAREAFTLMSATMDNVSQGVAVLDAERRLIAWNARYLELRGLDPAQMRGRMRLGELVNLGARLKVQTEGEPSESDAVLHLLEESHPFEVEARREDGTVLSVRGRSMAGDRYILTYTDVTAFKHSESAYRDQATRLTAILDNVVDAIITINESGSIESWSKGAERLFGYEAQEVLRRNVRILMPEPHASAHDGYLRRYMQTGEKRIIGARREVDARRKDGSVLPVDLGISEMHIGSRRLFIGIVRDISARREIEQLKSGFVSTVSHELRTPLTSISGSLGLLAGGVAGELPPKASRLIEIARLNSQRLVRLINDILDLEKAESGKLDLQLEKERIKSVVEQAVEMNRAYAQSFGATIIMQARTDAEVLVDRDRLIQVLTNLLSNAAKFSPPGGVISVAVQVGADAVQVSVADEGPGIPPEFQGRIFQRFAQADSSDTRSKGGTGLGLSICKKIMEMLGGGIEFTSASGKGTTFTITLPPYHEAPAYLTTPEPAFTGFNVLICEDDPDVAALLSEILRREGMRAESVGSARAARAALGAVRFDLALVDLHLPDGDGLGFIAELREREATRALPVIVVSARSGDAVASAAVSALHLADWLQKPIDPQRLLDAIRSVLRSREGRVRILHVEDDESLTQLVSELLTEEADLIAANSLASARQRMTEDVYDLVILDIALGDGSGLDLIPELNNLPAGAPPIILYSASEASRELSHRVEVALVKSRDSVQQLLTSVRKLLTDAGDAPDKNRISAAR